MELDAIDQLYVMAQDRLRTINAQVVGPALAKVNFLAK
jgi:hypothetical protein